jgi:hypothetical protein
MIAIWIICKSERMVKVGNIALFKCVGFADFNPNGRASNVSAFFKIKLSCVEK